jgi:hypothetical protein
MKEIKLETGDNISFDDFRAQILRDYKIAVTSRECSILGRREVLTGKAKFGIFGDGKELPQLAMARAFKDGDFRSGYYRDQTFMMALKLLTTKDFFHGLYATTELSLEPMSAGRQMGGHFVTYSLNEDGTWKDLTSQKNSSADISPTAAQMPRLLGLAQASKIYRNVNPRCPRTRSGLRLRPGARDDGDAAPDVRLDLRQRQGGPDALVGLRRARVHVIAVRRLDLLAHLGDGRPPATRSREEAPRQEACAFLIQCFIFSPPS